MSYSLPSRKRDRADVLFRAARPCFETLENRRLLSGFVADINFEPATAPIPAGYLADTGLVYGDRGNGLTYGWNAPHKAQVVARHPKKPSDGTDNLEDTFAFMRPRGTGSQWQIAVPDGNYQISITVGDASQNSGQYAIDINGAAFLAGKVKPRAGRWISASSKVTVTNGLLTLTVPRDRLAKIDFIDISQIVPTITTPPPLTESPFNGTPFATGQTIPAAQYDIGGQGLAFNVSTTTNPGNDSYRAPDPVGIDTGGTTGNVIADTTAGEWLNYTVDVATAGMYTLSASVSNSAAGGSFHAVLGGANVTGALAVPNTGDPTVFTTVTSGSFNVAAGTQTLGIYFDQAASNGTAGNFDTFDLAPATTGTPPADAPFNAAPFNTGQEIPFAQYDKGGQGVAFNVTTTTNPGNDTYRAPDPVGIIAGGSTGNVVGYTTAGEWLNYTVDVATAGNYVLQASAANADAGGSFLAEVGGVNLTGSISVPGTSSFTSYGTTTSNSFALSAGIQIIHVVLDTVAPNAAVGNFDSFELSPAPLSTGPTQPLVWNTVANAPIGVFEAHGIAVAGNLYVFGGFDKNEPQFESTNAAEAYNPATNTWATLAPMPVMESHTAVATDSTYIYVAGGYIYSPVTTYQTFGTTDVLRYDIANNTWSSITPLPSPRGGGELDYLDGELHYFGGLDGVNSTATKIPQTTHWMLDLSSADPQWVTAAPLPVPRNHLASVVLDGKIFAMGGRPTGADMVNPTTDLLVWDPANPDVWTEEAPLLQPRAVSTAAVYNGDIYLIGGTTTNYQIIATVDVYDPTTNTWTTQTSIPAGRFAPVAGVVGNTLIVTGGFSFADNGIFETNTWTATL